MIRAPFKPKNAPCKSHRSRNISNAKRRITLSYVQPISHLWNQGVVSAEAFIRDEKFRKDFRAAARRRQKKSKKSDFEKLLPDGRSKPVPSDFTVVYGVMRS